MTAIQIVTTVESKEQAVRIARHLVEHRLAACVQIGGPIESVYRWQGEIETGTEWTCTAKTLRSRYDDVERELLSIHPYDEPEILAVEVVAGSAGYLGWLAEQVGESQ